VSGRWVVGFVGIDETNAGSTKKVPIPFKGKTGGAEVRPTEGKKGKLKQG